VCVCVCIKEPQYIFHIYHLNAINNKRSTPNRNIWNLKERIKLVVYANNLNPLTSDQGQWIVNLNRMPPEAFYQQHKWALQWQHLLSQKPNYIQKWVDICCLINYTKHIKRITREKELNTQVMSEKKNKDQDHHQCQSGRSSTWKDHLATEYTTTKS
jgi:hypothetical protein